MTYCQNLNHLQCTLKRWWQNVKTLCAQNMIRRQLFTSPRASTSSHVETHQEEGSGAVHRKLKHVYVKANKDIFGNMFPSDMCFILSPHRKIKILAKSTLFIKIRLIEEINTARMIDNLLHFM